MLGAQTMFALLIAFPSPCGAVANCLRVTHEVPANSTPSRDDFAPADCDAPTRAFRYDSSSGLVRATRRLREGEVVRAAPEGLMGVFHAEGTFTLKSQVGPVVIERRVLIVRPLRRGGVLVRTADGDVFPVRETGATP